MGRQPGIQVMPVGVDYAAREHAEKLEGVLYATWDYSNAHELFQRIAWDGFVLRRGVLWYGWVPKDKMVKYHYVSPDDFYPEYDGDDIYHCVLVHRRHIEALKRDYPEFADKLEPDNSGETALIYGQDQPRMNQTNYITVYDYYDSDCNWVRIAGDYILNKANLGYKTKEVPFIEFPYNPSNGNREPRNGIDQLVELVQYLSQLISQKADIIRTYANPTVLDVMSGQAPEEIRRAVAAEGSVLASRPGRQYPLPQLGRLRPRASMSKSRSSWTSSSTSLASRVPRSAKRSRTSPVWSPTSRLTPTLQSNEAQETIWGKRLSLLNRRTLELVEKFGSGQKLVYRGRVPLGADLRSTKLIDLGVRWEGSRRLV